MFDESTSSFKKLQKSNLYYRRRRQNAKRNSQIEGGLPENTYYNLPDGFQNATNIAMTKRNQSSQQGEMTDDSDLDNDDSDLQNKVQSDGRIPVGLDTSEYEVVEMSPPHPNTSTNIHKDKLKDHIKNGNFIKEYQVSKILYMYVLYPWTSPGLR